MKKRRRVFDESKKLKRKDHSKTTQDKTKLVQDMNHLRAVQEHETQ